MLRLTDRIIEYENGELTGDEMLQLFTDLINTGLIWSLQGHYQREAKRLVESGLIEIQEHPHDG